MVEQIFGTLFLAALVAPAAAVVAGIGLLVWPERTKAHDVTVGRGLSAHA